MGSGKSPVRRAIALRTGELQMLMNKRAIV